MMPEQDDFASSLTSDDLVRGLLDNKLGSIEKAFGDSDAITFIGPLAHSADQLVKVAIESLGCKKSELLFIIETGGGYIETVERIVNVLRYHYDKVNFLIPDYAMSAGTVLVMSGDRILMDYYSILGPIDPQVQRPGSEDSIPVQGYLAQYERLLEKASAGQINTAELHILTSRFDQAEIYKFEQAVELSVTLLKAWLVEYKFKDWTKTEKQGKEVTLEMKQLRAEEIARELGDTARWHTHGRGIPMSVLRRDLNLRIDDFGESSTLKRSLSSYNVLLRDYMARTHHRSVVHVRGFYLPFE